MATIESQIGSVVSSQRPMKKYTVDDPTLEPEELKDIPEVDTSCILGPFGPSFTWQTTSIKSITANNWAYTAYSIAGYNDGCFLSFTVYWH